MTDGVQEWNVALVRRWFAEVWNEARAEAIDSMFAADAVAHGIGLGPIHGPREFRAFRDEALRTFPGWTFEVEETVAQDDRVAARLTGRFDRDGVTVTTEVACFFEIRDGTIRRMRNSWDRLGLIQQLQGLSPAQTRLLAPMLR